MLMADSCLRIMAGGGCQILMMAYAAMLMILRLITLILPLRYAAAYDASRYADDAITLRHG